MWVFVRLTCFNDWKTIDTDRMSRHLGWSIRLLFFVLPVTHKMSILSLCKYIEMLLKTNQLSSKKKYKIKRIYTVFESIRSQDMHQDRYQKLFYIFLAVSLKKNKNPIDAMLASLLDRAICEEWKKKTRTRKEKTTKQAIRAFRLQLYLFISHQR